MKLVSTKSNRSAIGARVIARYGDKVQAQNLTSQSSYISSNDPRLRFGLGDEMSADIEIRWPNGLQELLKNISANQLVTITEGLGITATTKFDSSKAPRQKLSGLMRRHRCGISDEINTSTIRSQRPGALLPADGVESRRSVMRIHFVQHEHPIRSIWRRFEFA